MKHKMIVCIVTTLLMACGGSPTDEKSHNLIIATATTGGTYYPVGVALGTIMTQKLAPTITASAINSAGSGENIQMLVNKEAHLAILQGLYGAMAYRGRGTYEGQPIKDIRAITMLWENVEHFLLLTEYAKTGNIQDLQSLKQKYSIGKRGSGTEGSTRTILSALGINPENDVTPEYLGYSPSVQAMIDGRITGASTPAGPPVAAVTQALAQLGDEVSILSFTDAQLQKVRAEFPVWTAYTLPVNTYPGQKQAIQTIAQPNFLACHANLPNDLIYTLTKTIYENLTEIQNIHKATLAMKLEKAIAGLAVPLHPGAAKFYQEKGLNIPENLITP